MQTTGVTVAEISVARPKNTDRADEMSDKTHTKRLSDNKTNTNVAFVDHTVTRLCDQCYKGDASSQSEKANLPLSPHPHPLTDSHEYCTRDYALTSHIWSKSPQGLLLSI